ncbi:MAG: hypothetical protein JO001_14365 [Alphaproteobacteria bacterium]|nr:hypothetical protein [Alphaproteobacteria bacterium]
MPKATRVSTTSRYHNHSLGDLADEHGTICAQIADLESRRKAIGAALISRGVTAADGALFHAIVIPATSACTIDRKAIESAMGEAWLSRYLKWSTRSGYVKTTARAAAVVRLAA